MENATAILESLDAAELQRRLDAIDREREALRILHRAALRLERQQNKAAVPATAEAAT
jgi:hypothetical protein